MNVRLNGRDVRVDDGATVSDLVAAAGVEGEARGVAVAVDGEVVPRSAWSETNVGAGQEVEVLEARQGG